MKKRQFEEKKEDENGAELKRSRYAPPATTIVQFISGETGEESGPPIDIPTSSATSQLESALNALVSESKDGGEGDIHEFSFYLAGLEITSSLSSHISLHNLSTETSLQITYHPLSMVNVRPVTRCADTMEGHEGPVLHLSFSPGGGELASGGGDMLVRFWDTTTSTTKAVGRGHKNHVLCTSWSPDGAVFASGDKNGEIR